MFPKDSRMHTGDTAATAAQAASCDLLVSASVLDDRPLLCLFTLIDSNECTNADRNSSNCFNYSSWIKYGIPSTYVRITN